MCFCLVFLRFARCDGGPPASSAAIEEEWSRWAGCGSRFGCRSESVAFAGLPFGFDDSLQSAGSMVLRPAHLVVSPKRPTTRHRGNPKFFFFFMASHAAIDVKVALPSIQPSFLPPRVVNKKKSCSQSDSLNFLFPLVVVDLTRRIFLPPLARSLFFSAISIGCNFCSGLGDFTRVPNVTGMLCYNCTA